MSRRFTSGFSILGLDDDPTPGDPDQIDQLARFYQDIGDDAATGLRVLGRGGTLSSARGESMEKLRGMLDKLPGKLQATAASFDAAAQAYRAYALVLREQQSRVDTAMDQATAVAADARRATPQAAADATPLQIADVRAQVDQITGARAQLSAAQRLAEDARRLRESASARCRRELDDAADKAIKPPPRRRFFQRIGDLFRNNPIFQLFVDIFISVVGIVFPVVGIVLAAIQVVVTAVVQAKNGNFELGTLLVGLVSLVPAGKLIGPFTRGAEAVAPSLVKTAQNSAKVFGEIGENSTVVKGLLNSGGRAGDFGRDVVTDFGKGVVEGVATTGLNQLGDKDADGFSAASVFGTAAAGSVAGNLADGLRKGASRGLGFDTPSDADLGDGFQKGTTRDADVGAPSGGGNDTTVGTPSGNEAGRGGGLATNTSEVAPDGGPPLPPRPEVASDGGPPLPPRPEVASDGGKFDAEADNEDIGERAAEAFEDDSAKVAQFFTGDALDEEERPATSPGGFAPPVPPPPGDPGPGGPGPGDPGPGDPGPGGPGQGGPGQGGARPAPAGSAQPGTDPDESPEEFEAQADELGIFKSFDRP